MNLLKGLFLLAVACTARVCSAQSKQYILLLAKGTQQLRVLDYNTLDSITSLTLGADPHEIVTNAEGSLAYISNPILNGSGHVIDVIDLRQLKVLPAIDTKPFYTPHGLAYQDGQLWFTAQGSKAVVVYDTKAEAVTQVLGTGQDFTHLLYLQPGAKGFYATNVESGTLSIYEQTKLPPYMPPTGVLPANARERLEWRQTLLPVGAGAEGFDVAPDAKELWTARPDGHVIVVDLEHKKLVKDIDTKVAGLHRLKFTPDGKQVCVVSVKTGDLLWMDVAARRITSTQQVGHGAGIYMDKERNRMFISCTPDNYVTVIDLTTHKELRRLPVPRPDGITSVKVLP